MFRASFRLAERITVKNNSGYTLNIGNKGF